MEDGKGTYSNVEGCQVNDGKLTKWYGKSEVRGVARLLWGSVL